MKVTQTALWKLINPIAIVTARSNERVSGFISSWITQTSFVPPLVMVAINPKHYTWTLINESEAFAINVLRADQDGLVDLFGKTSGKKVDKFASIAYELGITGSPLLKDCLASLDCTVAWSREAGDHIVVVADIVDARVVSEGETLRETRSMYATRASIP